MLLDDAADESLGRHPWDPPYPIVLDMNAALDLGYTPVGDYASTVAAEVEWLVATARGATEPKIFPGFDDMVFHRFFDYAAEDRYLATDPG